MKYSLLEVIIKNESKQDYVNLKKTEGSSELSSVEIYILKVFSNLVQELLSIKSKGEYYDIIFNSSATAQEWSITIKSIINNTYFKENKKEEILISIPEEMDTDPTIPLTLTYMLVNISPNKQRSSIISKKYLHFNELFENKKNDIRLISYQVMLDLTVGRIIKVQYKKYMLESIAGNITRK